MYDKVSSRVLEGDEQVNWIYANNYGCELWGGNGGNDYLYGGYGDGDDTFIAGQGEGNTYISNCNENDLVYLYNMNLDDVAYFSKYVGRYGGKYLYLTANDETYIEIAAYKDVETTTLQFSDGLQLRYNFTDSEWQKYDDANDAWQSTVLSTDMAIGWEKSGSTAYIYSDYVGDVRLTDLNDNAITRVYAWYDTVSGRVLEGDEQDNAIWANDYGCSLWGGNGGNDYLYGGSGDDTFRAGQGEGNTYIRNCNENDLVYLYNMNLEDVASFGKYVGSSRNSLYLRMTKLTSKSTPTMKMSRQRHCNSLTARNFAATSPTANGRSTMMQTTRGNRLCYRRTWRSAGRKAVLGHMCIRIMSEM